MMAPALDVTSRTGAPSLRGYPSRTEPLPRAFEKVDATWLTRTLQNRYPELVVEAMKVEQFVGSHTTKVRIKVDLNVAGKAAGVPDHLCLKSNWSGAFEEGRHLRDRGAVLPLSSRPDALPDPALLLRRLGQRRSGAGA